MRLEARPESDKRQIIVQLPHENDLLSLAQIVREYGIGYETARKKAKSGEWRHLRLGCEATGRYLIPRWVIDAWVRDKLSPGPASPPSATTASDQDEGDAAYDHIERVVILRGTSGDVSDAWRKDGG
jgi:hypothetical protein